MILADTSAWVEFLRATGSPTHKAMRSLIQTGEELASTDIVVMELLAGARDESHHDQLRRLVLGYEVIPLHGLTDCEAAASIFRRCRRNGETIRSLTDCLIAAVALRTDVELLHVDRDYAAISRHFPLRVVAPQGAN